MSFDAKQMEDLLSKSLKEIVPTVVADAVDAKMEDVQKGLDEKFEKVDNQVKELAKKGVTKNTGDDEPKDEETIKKEFGAALKKFVRGDDSLMTKALNEGTDADGGYLVPDEFTRQVQHVAEINGVARRLCRIWSMSGKTRDITKVVTGVTAGLVGEAATITTSNPTFGEVVINARKIAAISDATSELIEDNQADMEVFDMVAMLAGESIAEVEDAQVLTGDGTGLNATGLLTDANVNLVTMAATNTSFADISSDDLYDVKNAVAMKYKKNRKPAWFMSQDIWNHIEKLKDSQGRSLLVPSLNDPTKFTLLGFPVEVTEVMPDDSDDAISTKFLAFGDLYHFAFGDRKSVTMEMGYKSTGFEDDVKSMKIVERVGFVNVFPAAFAVLRTAAA